MLVHVSKLSFFLFYFYYYVLFISFYFIICLFDVYKFFQFCFYFKYEGCMLISSITILVEVSFNCYFFLHCVLLYIVFNYIPTCFFMCYFIYQTLTFLLFCFISSILCCLCVFLWFFVCLMCVGSFIIQFLFWKYWSSFFYKKIVVQMLMWL